MEEPDAERFLTVPPAASTRLRGTSPETNALVPLGSYADVARHTDVQVHPSHAAGP